MVSWAQSPPNPVKVSSQIGPGSGYQRRQPGEKVLRSEQNMSGAIAERVLEFVAHLAGWRTFPISMSRFLLQIVARWGKNRVLISYR